MSASMIIGFVRRPLPAHRGYGDGKGEIERCAKERGKRKSVDVAICTKKRGGCVRVDDGGGGYRERGTQTSATETPERMRELEANGKEDPRVASGTFPYSIFFIANVSTS